MKNPFIGFVKTAAEAVTSAASAVTSTAEESYVAVKTGAESAGRSAVAAGKSVGEVICTSADATLKFAGEAGDVVGATAEKTFVVLRDTANSVGQSASTAGKVAGSAIGIAASSAGDFAGKVGVLVGDLNGDGKVDFEDAKIAAAKIREVASDVAVEVGKLGRSAMQSDLVKEAAAGALLGGALASVIPGVGTVSGAVLGAAIVTYKNVVKK